MPLDASGFDESIGFDDPHPSGRWSPSPRQIREWSAIIRRHNEQLAEAAEQAKEQLRRSRLRMVPDDDDAFFSE